MKLFAQADQREVKCNIIIILYCTLPSAIHSYCTGNECNIQYCTRQHGFRLSLEPSFDAKIDKARTYAINIVALFHTIHIFSYTCMGHPICVYVPVWETHTCMGIPIRVWDKQNCPYVYGMAHTRMGKIHVWYRTVFYL